MDHDKPLLSSDISAVLHLHTISRPPQFLWTLPPPRHAYSKSTLFSLRHNRRHPLSPTDPICRPPTPQPLSPPRTTAKTAKTTTTTTAGHTEDVLLSPSDAHLTFSDLALPLPILRALSRSNFQHPSPIQLAALPTARQGADMIVRSKSGTGKTLVYAIVAAEIAIGAFETCAALVLAPTRELAMQIATCVKGLVEEIGANVDLFIGGTPERKDVARLTGRVPAIVVGTPGRVLSLMEKGVLEIGEVKLLVLDEADRLIDGSLGDAVPNICAKLGGKKQTLVFSATFPLKLEQLLMKVMRKPKYVHAGEGEGVYRRAVLLGVRQRKVEINEVEGGLEGKMRFLRELLQYNPFSFCVVFLNEKKSGAYVTRRVCEDGISGAWINADIPQSQRSSVMELVRSGEIRVVVTTDLLARGVDVETCDLVVHLDVPLDPTTYLHRVGRAGRFGKLGLSILVYGGEEETVAVDRLETTLGYRLRQFDVSPKGVVLRKIEDEAGADEQTTHKILEVRKEVQKEPGGSHDFEMEGGNQENLTDVHRLSPMHRGHLEAQPLKADEERDVMLVEVCAGEIVEDQFEANEFKKDFEKKAENDFDTVAEENIDQTNGIELNDNETNTGTDKYHVIGSRKSTGEAENFKVNGNGTGVASAVVVGNGGATEEHNDEAWDELAKKAYRKGFGEGYERAYRLAKTLGTRLGWGGS